MDVRKLSWSELALRIESDRHSRSGSSGVRLKRPEAIAMIGEVYNRLDLLPRRVLLLSDRERELVMLLAMQQFLDFLWLRRIALAWFLRHHPLRLLKTDARRCAKLRRGEVPTQERAGSGVIDARSVVGLFTPLELEVLRAMRDEPLTVKLVAAKFGLRFSAAARLLLSLHWKLRKLRGH